MPDYGKRGAPYGPRQPDPVKKAIADTVTRSGILAVELSTNAELDLHSVEVHEISPTEWQYRVRTNSNGTRYFKLKLSEMM